MVTGQGEMAAWAEEAAWEQWNTVRVCHLQGFQSFSRCMRDACMTASTARRQEDAWDQVWGVIGRAKCLVDDSH